MTRNIKKDQSEELRRKNQLLEVAFDLFSKQGIESVKLSDIATNANVGIATLYKYYKNKVNLVVEISASIWKKTLEEYLIIHSIEELYSFSAYQLIEIYLDRIIYIYNEHPEFLRFSGNYKTFINQEKASKEDILSHTKVLETLEILFHTKYEEAKIDKSIRTDIEEKEMFFMFTITMLSMAERYALGVVWANTNKENHTKELLYLKEMILNWSLFKGEAL